MEEKLIFLKEMMSKAAEKREAEGFLTLIDIFFYFL